MYQHLQQYRDIYPRYENRQIEYYRRRQDLRFLKQFGKYDLYVTTNYTAVFAVWGEFDEQYVSASLIIAKDSEVPWVKEAYQTLKNWRYIRED